MVVVAEPRRCFEPDRMVIDWPGKLEVPEGMGCSGPPDRGVEIQGKVDLAMGTVFCGKGLVDRCWSRRFTADFWLDNLRIRYHFE